MNARLPPWCGLGARSAPSRGPPSSRRSTAAAARTATAGSSPRRALGGGPCGRSWTGRASSRAAKRERRHGSYQGEASEAPDDLLRDGRGKHHLRSGRPSELWVTDVTGFRIPAGKPYLPPIIGCFDGMPMSWAMSASPDAGMANSSLMGACARLREGERPKGHSDRGCHYRWPEWIKICDGHGIVRSMPGEGCGPDNARAEGFFGRPKVGFFYGRDWGGVTPDGFADVLDAYLGWHRDVRPRSDLGYRGPMQYRRDLGLIA